MRDTYCTDDGQEEREEGGGSLNFPPSFVRAVCRQAWRMGHGAWAVSQNRSGVSVGRVPSSASASVRIVVFIYPIPANLSCTFGLNSSRPRTHLRPHAADTSSVLAPRSTIVIATARSFNVQLPYLTHHENCIVVMKSSLK